MSAESPRSLVSEAIGREILTLDTEGMWAIAPYLRAPRFLGKRYECTPRTTAPEDIEAAYIAEKLLNAGAVPECVSSSVCPASPFGI
jgi:hypothetical protein